MSNNRNEERTMTRSKTPRILLTNLLVAAAAALPVTACAQSSFDDAQEIALPQSQLEYVAINPAISMAAAYGNRGDGAHGSFGQFPENFITPEHTHTGAYHGVVIRGVMTNPFKGEENPPKMGPGSYWYVPAGTPHATACVSAEPCEFYFHADGAFDFLPVK
jgi:hypothetical protein